MEFLKFPLSILAGFLIGTFLTGSDSIGLAFGFVSALAPRVLAARRGEKINRDMQMLWPEILDHLISGLNSGLALNKAVATLSDRGPVITRNIFKEFENNIKSGVRVENAINAVASRFADSLADQVCVVLHFANQSGSRDSALTLRTLASHIRSDLALRNEIRAKHGWIKNAAILAGIAPWILLVILSTQSSTRSAYSTKGGVAVLIFGILLTLIAYFWMERVGRLDMNPRVFGV